MEFLGHIVDQHGLHTATDKVQAVVEWPPLTDVKDVQCFLGLANYYHRFIDGYSGIVSPLTKLLRKNTPWQWTSIEQAAFDKLKQKLVSAPVLALPDPSKRFFVHTDASTSVAIGGILSQEQADGKLHPVAFISRSLTPVEKNYAIYDLELLALKYCLHKWRHHLDMQTFTVFTDNRALSNLRTSSNLSKRQIRWLETFISYKFDVHHLPREHNHAADALSKRPPSQVSHPQASRELHLVHRVQLGDDMGAEAKGHYGDDEWTEKLLAQLRVGLDVEPYSLVDQVIYRQVEGKDRQLCIPRMPTILSKILYDAHDSTSGGHRGIDATVERIARQYYWPNIAKSVRRYISSCDSCQRNKPSRQKPAGLIQPLPPPLERWQSVSMDFVTQLPKTSNGYDSIMVVVDRLSKRAHFIPAHVTDTAEDVAHMFLREVYRHHGFPQEIISDRDTKFTSRFWKAMTESLQITRKLSTTAHPETDGQTERTNSTMADLLRHYVAYDQKDWDIWLPIVEHAYNNTYQASIKMSPFFCDLGRNMPSPIDQPKISSNESVAQLQHRLETIKDLAVEHIKTAAERQKKYANKKRRDEEFVVGDEVLVDQNYLSPHNFATSAGRKLASKRVGPYEIIEKIGKVAYRLKLPENIKAHNVFHVRVLQRYHHPKEASRKPLRPDPILVQDTEEYEVETLIDKRIHRRRTEYLVKWLGYPVFEATWEPVQNLDNAQALIAEFEARQSKQSTAKSSRQTTKTNATLLGPVVPLQVPVSTLAETESKAARRQRHRNVAGTQVVGLRRSQ